MEKQGGRQQQHGSGEQQPALASLLVGDCNGDGAVALHGKNPFAFKQWGNSVRRTSLCSLPRAI